MRRLIVGLLAVLIFPVALEAANPCVDLGGGTLAVNPTRVVATLEDYGATVLGSSDPLITAWEMRWYQEGAPQAFQALTVPRVNWTLETGTTDCYGAGLSAVPFTPNVRLRATLISKGNPAYAVGDSPPSGESNPFGRLGPLAAVPVVRLTRP